MELKLGGKRKTKMASSGNWGLALWMNLVHSIFKMSVHSIRLILFTFEFNYGLKN
jgi:hypothetical protein